MFEHLLFDKILCELGFLGNEVPELEVSVELGPAFGDCGWNQVEHLVQKQKHVSAHFRFCTQESAIFTLPC
jgi:hypothetical protein